MADLYVWLMSIFFLIALLVLVVYQITRTTSEKVHIQQHKMEANPSSSSSFSPAVKKYDVFLSFRGDDTRNNFTSHLSLALRKIGLFSIFRDDYALDKGKDIGPELIKAIEDSYFAVVVLSENYATSSWCLKELAKIVECMGDSGRIRTIFYHVDPSHLRNVISSDAKKQQESSFWKALEEHAKNPSNSEHLESWRNALVEVANLSGHTVDAHTDEASFIKSFVAGISSELRASIRTIDGLFGMSSRLSVLDSYVLQSAGTNKPCFIGIHGMGGIGKSTLAAVYCKKMSHKFDGSSFLQNIREACEKKVNGLVSLQKRLLKDILEEDFKQIGNTHNGREMIKSRLRHKKVLIVLDDVSQSNQLDELAGAGDWFGSGSIILVTTRDGSFLNPRRYTIYGLELLNPSESLQLFSSKAFENIEPPEKYKVLSERAVEYTGCLPLALTVLGSSLRDKTTSQWKSALSRLRKAPEKKIVENLKISFEDLTEYDQRIFLDIACFFNGFDKYLVIEFLDSCGFDPEIGIQTLIDKSLLSIYKDKWGRSTILMHDLLQVIGKEIGRQSRIWDEDRLSHILENREEAKEVEAIVTHLVRGKKYRLEALSSMKNLRLLQISGPVDFECDGPGFSCNLQYLDWEEFPFTKFTSSFCELVQLKISNSQLRQLCCTGTQVPNLKKLILNNCPNLLEIHLSIKHLNMLDLTNCTTLKRLPKEINDLISLQTLNLYGCTSLERLPEEINGLTSLQILNLYGCTSLERLPEEINGLTSLQILDLHGCKSLEKLPEEINGLGNILRLDLSRCTSLKKFSEHINGLTSLRILNFYGCTSLERLAEVINGLNSLRILDLRDCKSLKRLAEKINGLNSLETLDFLSCPKLKRLANEINGLTFLKTLTLPGCTSRKIGQGDKWSDIFPDH